MGKVIHFVKMLFDIDSTGSNWIMIVTLDVTLISLIVGYIAYVFRKRSKIESAYRDCAKSLYSSNSIEQTSAAILLRDFITKRQYSAQTKNLIVALLRLPISVSLQKTLADGFSYAKSLKGQDLQWVNMCGALIKPNSRIKYELHKTARHKMSRISMKQADCYHAIMQECNINNVKAEKTVFFCANLMGTSFRNCLFNGADFRCANLKDTIFDEDCELEKAVFDGAVGLKEAIVKVKEEDKNGKTVIKKYPLIEFLDEDAIFRSERKGIRYVNKNGGTRIFVSKLGAMDAFQKIHYNNVLKVIENVFEDIELDYIDREHYPVVSQLPDVMSHMAKCDGCVIFAFEYLQIEKGCIHSGIVGNDRKQMDNIVLASPWLHIEAALANQIKMPCLIIYDHDVFRDGMFDEKIVNPDLNLFAMEYSDSIQSSDIILDKWRSRVQEYQLKTHNDLKMTATERTL